MHWWAPGATFVREPDTEPEQEDLEALEEVREHRESREEGMFRRESITSSQGVKDAEKPEDQPGDGDLHREPVELEDIIEAEEARGPSQ